VSGRCNMNGSNPISTSPHLLLRRRPILPPASNPSPRRPHPSLRHVLPRRFQTGGGRFVAGITLPRGSGISLGTPAEDNVKWVRSGGEKKHVAKRWTNLGLTPPLSLCVYLYAGNTVSTSSSRRWPRSPTPSDDDWATKAKQEPVSPAH
jgi:hypothetical protein